jgi:hypothetical protein
VSHPPRNAIVLRIPLPPEDYVPLVLANRCRDCEGTGDTGDQVFCDKCSGAGLLLTREGHQILDLLEYFGGKS